MKIDLYIKGILTVIAFALVIIVAKDIVPTHTAHADMISTDPVAKWEVAALLKQTEINIIKSLLLCVKERGYCRYKTNLEYRDDY
jgi:hypothetical protein